MTMIMILMIAIDTMLAHTHIHDLNIFSWSHHRVHQRTTTNDLYQLLLLALHCIGWTTLFPLSRRLLLFDSIHHNLPAYIHACIPARSFGQQGLDWVI